MKKYFLSILLALSMISIFACGKKPVPKTMMLGGVEYDSKFVRSGYYFDKASLSEANLAEMLEKVEIIEKPDSFGEVTLPDFSTIELTNNKKEEITEQMIEAEIEKERDKEVTYSPVKVKREAKMTDKVIIDFKGYVDGVAFDGGEMNDYELILGSESFIPGFEESVAGHKAGSKFTIHVTFPEEYDPSLAGKDATFDITIKSMEEASTPEVNDEFVKRHTMKGSTTVAAYKEEIKDLLEKRQEYMNNQNLTYQLYEKLLSDSKFNPTEEALAWQFSIVINQMKQQSAAMGMNIATLIASSGGSMKDTFDEIKSSIPEYIKVTMAIDAIMKRYKIELTEDDVKDWFLTMASMMGFGDDVSYDEYKKFMGYDNMLDAAKQSEALIRAAHECKIVEEKEEE